MVSRRAFLAALTALPLVGKLTPQRSARPCDYVTAADLQREFNYWNSRKMELIAMAPRAPYVSQDVDPRDAEFLSSDQWPDSVRAERIKTDRPV